MENLSAVKKIGQEGFPKEKSLVGEEGMMA